jgi:hypothetical protein
MKPLQIENIFKKKSNQPTKDSSGLIKEEKKFIEKELHFKNTDVIHH